MSSGLASMPASSRSDASARCERLFELCRNVEAKDVGTARIADIGKARGALCVSQDQCCANGSAGKRCRATDDRQGNYPCLARSGR